MILAVLTRSDPPISLPKRAACIGGDIILDRRWISDAEANAKLFEWGMRAAKAEHDGNLPMAREIARAAVQLELAIREARRVAPVHGFQPFRTPRAQ